MDSVADAGAVQFPQSHAGHLSVVIIEGQLLEPLGDTSHQRITGTLREQAQLSGIGSDTGAVAQFEAQEPGLQALQQILQPCCRRKAEAAVELKKQQILITAASEQIPEDLLQALEIVIAVEPMQHLMPTNGTGVDGEDLRFNTAVHLHHQHLP